MVLSPVSAALSASVERLYDVFAMYKQPASSHSSPFAGITEQHKARLYSWPLRDLAEDDLWPYAMHAMTTWGDISEYKHYLPRLCELLVVHPGWTDTGLLIGKLDTAEWSQWPEVERDAVIAFLHELWAWSLTIDPDDASCGGILWGFGLAGISAARALTTWRSDRSWSATRQIAVLLIYERDALLTSGSLSRQWMSPVREELLAFLREEDTRERLSAACLDSGGQPGADEICDAVDVLEFFRGSVNS
jgi:hypothetical protein